MILPKVRDPRFVTIRRGGTLTDADHRLLALWAADCAEHVLPLFEAGSPADPRPRRALEVVRAWARGEVRMSESRAAGGHAMAAARALSGPPRHAAYAAGQVECRWQCAQLPDRVRALVLDDQRLRNHLCWNAFDC